MMVQPFNHNEEESFQPTRVSIKDEDLMDVILFFIFLTFIYLYIYIYIYIYIDDLKKKKYRE
jgi:hypothetical protein